MPFLSDTIQGWQNVCMDADCNFNTFKKIANIMETKLGIVFTQKIDSTDTSYWDFYFYNSNLTLSYNIYEGITIFPTAFGAASETDNTNTLTAANLIFNELAVVNWHDYLDGKTIGKKGSEGGTIIEDFENLNGARITVEKECNGIPYAITWGIYSLMFYTRYEETKEAAITYLSETKFNINKVFELYDVSEDNRNEYWQTKHHKLLDEIAK